MDSSRRLVAIVFADVVGYTAMMQKDEGHAMAVINRFNEMLTTLVPAHGGEIIKGYGDGTILFFKSAREAVDLSISLQKAFREKPFVPLRIGVHLGEVIMREEDYFGNDINISSRIESMGVSGAVLLSRSIFERVRNQSHLKPVSLGFYQFKNVEDEMEVFALANDDLVVPDKRKVQGKFAEKSFAQKYQLPLLLLLIGTISILAFLFLKPSQEIESKNPVLGKKVVVLPFENLTDDDKLVSLSTMSSDWITQILLANEAAQVVAPSQTEIESALNEGDYTSIVEKLGADLIITGNFYPDEGEVFMTSKVLDANNREVIYALPILRAPAGKPVTLLNGLQQELLGSWFLGSDDWVESNPPRYDAYREFLALREVWGKDNGQSEILIGNALQQDSTFYRPLISLAQLYFNSYRYDKADSIIKVLQTSDFPLTNFEKMRLNSIQAQLNYNWSEAAQISEEMFRRYRQYEQGLDAVTFNLRINKPSQSLVLIQESVELLEVGDCYQCQSIFSSRIDALVRLGRWQEAADLTLSVRDQIIDADIAINHLRALVKLYQMDQVKIQLDYYKTRPLEWFGMYNPNLLYWAIAQELYLSDKGEALARFSQDMLSYVQNHPDHSTYEQDLYFVYFLQGNLDLALVNVNKSVDEFGSFYEADQVVLQILHGNTKAGREFLARERPVDSDFGEWDYSSAKVLTALGRKNEAIDALQKAFDRGQSFLWYTFENDVFLKGLHSESAFHDLVNPR